MVRMHFMEARTQVRVDVGTVVKEGILRSQDPGGRTHERLRRLLEFKRRNIDKGRLRRVNWGLGRSR